MENPQDLKCKGCKRETHPAYLDRYDGYCLDCSNAGVPERDEEIEKLERDASAMAMTIRDLRDEFGSLRYHADRLRNGKLTVASSAFGKWWGRTRRTA